MEDITSICNPFISYVPADNFVFSLLPDDTPIFREFILNHYYGASVNYCEEQLTYNVFRFSDTYQWERFKMFEYIYIPKQHVIDLKEEMLVNLLQDNYVILLCVDVFYIPDYLIKNREHYSHEIMIHGCDVEKKVFFCKDFFTGVYSNRPIPYDTIMRSIRNYNLTNCKAITGLVALRKKKDYEYNTKGNINDIIHKIKEHFEDWNYILYAAEEYIFNNYNSYNFGSIRALFHLLRETIRLMEKRRSILIMSEIADFQECGIIMQKCMDVKKHLSAVRNQLLKEEYILTTNSRENINGYIMDNFDSIRKEYLSLGSYFI